MRAAIRRSDHVWSPLVIIGVSAHSYLFFNSDYRSRLPFSRMKKIKCIQATPESVPCEACHAAGITCRFRDRERYYAERSRIAAAQAAASKGSSSERSRKSSSHEPDPAISSISQAPRDDSTTSQGGAARCLFRHANSYHPYRVPSPQLEPHLRSSPESDTSTPPPYGPLFCPNDPAKPHSEIMMTFIQAFFDNLNPDFPFLAYDETIRQFFTHSLSRLLANCIAAHAVRFTDIPEVTRRGIMHASDQYCDRAKVRRRRSPVLRTHALWFIVFIHLCSI
jgi:hypothetical protein